MNRRALFSFAPLALLPIQPEWVCRLHYHRRAPQEPKTLLTWKQLRKEMESWSEEALDMPILISPQPPIAVIMKGLQEYEGKHYLVFEQEA